MILLFPPGTSSWNPRAGLSLLQISSQFPFLAFRTDTVGYRAPSFPHNLATPRTDSLKGSFPLTFMHGGYNPDPMLRGAVAPGKWWCPFYLSLHVAALSSYPTYPMMILGPQIDLEALLHRIICRFHQFPIADESSSVNCSQSGHCEIHADSGKSICLL